MCCGATETLDLPAEVIEALAHYRRLRDQRGWDWGREQLPDLFRWARFSLLGPVMDAVATTGDWPDAVRAVIGDEVPAGVVVVRLDDGGGLHADVGPARPAIAGATVAVDVVVDSAAEDDRALVVAGRDVEVGPGGAAIETIDVDGADPAFTVALATRRCGSTARSGPWRRRGPGGSGPCRTRRSGAPSR